MVGNMNILGNIHGMKLTVAALAIVTASAVIAAPGSTELVSERSPTESSSGESETPSMSRDGRYVVYQSSVADLVAGDTNERIDIFLYDRQTGNTERISVGSDGSQANSDSRSASISSDGRFVAFSSFANNLVPGDTNDCVDLFLRDRLTGRTERISVDAYGNQANGNSQPGAITPDARYVVFTSQASNLVVGDTNEATDIFVRDLANGTTERVSLSNEETQGMDASRAAAISDDGRYVSFESASSNLVANDTNGYPDIFVRDRLTGTTARVSVASSGAQGNLFSQDSAISSDGRFVAFTSNADNLVPGDTNGQQDIFVRDRALGVTERVNLTNSGTQGTGSAAGFSGAFYPSISSDGRYVSFLTAANLVPEDSDAGFDTYLRDRIAHATERLSMVGEQPTNPILPLGKSSINADGRYVAIHSNDRLFVWDRQTAALQPIPKGNSRSGGGVTTPVGKNLSGDGRYAVFQSDANLAAGYSDGLTDVFLRDTQTGTTELVSKAADGRGANFHSYYPSIGASGRYVVFTSTASNLVDPGGIGTDFISRIYLRDRETQLTESVSVGLGGEDANGSSWSPSVSADGRYVAFQSGATNLVAGSPGSGDDVFVRDRQLGTTRRITVGLDGQPSDGATSYVTISDDGRYVAYESEASNLVANDTNASKDVFVHDLQTGRTVRASLTNEGEQATGGASNFPAISADGRYVAFGSEATNLLAGSGYNYQVFVRDLVANTTETIGIGPGGTRLAFGGSQPGISADGRYVTFSSVNPDGCNCVGAVFIRDRANQSTALVSVNSQGEAANRDSRLASISADGHHVLFTSRAANLTDGDFNEADDVFVRELELNATVAIRINAGGGTYRDSQGRLWSADSGFNTGSVATSAAPIAGTTDDLLYQSLRWDDSPAPELQYTLPVPVGDYVVKLYFAESRSSTAYVGGRVFDVEMEGSLRFDNLDVFAQAGGINTALVKTANVSVTDGQLNIRFLHQVRNPIVSAIEIVPRVGGGTSGLSVRTNAGGGNYKDSQGRTWLADSGFNTGAASTSNTPIAGTTDDSLYQSIRWDDSPAPELQYTYALPNGIYRVNLHFAEANPATAYAGARVFDVDMQGIQRFADLDVFAEAGGINKALVKSTLVTVSNGTLAIMFRHQVKNPIVSAIEIIGQ